jgi:ASC-1-like (ASCH) protein
MEIHVSDPYFYLIKTGVKVVEGKKRSPSWQNLKTGDKIKITNGIESIDIEIVGINWYRGRENNLRDYLISETLERTLPGVKTIEEGERIYTSPPINWTYEEINKYGVIAIQIKLI